MRGSKELCRERALEKCFHHARALCCALDGTEKEWLSDKAAWQRVPVPVDGAVSELHVSAPLPLKVLSLLLISQCNGRQRKHNCCSVSLKINISSAQTEEKTPSPLTNKQCTDQGKALETAAAHCWVSTFPFCIVC